MKKMNKEPLADKIPNQRNKQKHRNENPRTTFDSLKLVTNGLLLTESFTDNINNWLIYILHVMYITDFIFTIKYARQKKMLLKYSRKRKYIYYSSSETASL